MTVRVPATSGKPRLRLASDDAGARSRLQAVGACLDGRTGIKKRAKPSADVKLIATKATISLNRHSISGNKIIPLKLSAFAQVHTHPVPGAKPHQRHKHSSSGRKPVFDPKGIL